ncbi:MAG: prepilin-type N-terminal cleavage/methylation domain-containing protein [Rhodospirillales bacterium]|nr:prepilin-type N-terminal cleavage/methylation domain-containing protein [Rhodospirillales bacterium]
MSHFTNKADSKQAGFTLVELAIVMIIIGLLIGGVLKGQELIGNAQVTSTVAQIKAIDAATSSFDDMYDGIPGDIDGTRLPDCAAACAPAVGATTNNGQIDSSFAAAPAPEGRAAFLQLSAADLLSGVDINAGQVWGGEFPEAKIPGAGFHAAFWAGGATLPSQQGGVAAAVRRGHYLALHGTQNGAVDGVGTLTPQQAFRIDNKMDDGVVNSGGVLAAGAGTCINGNNYNESNAGGVCNLYIRFQN